MREVNNQKPNPSNYNLNTDSGRTEWNKVITEWWKVEKKKTTPPLIYDNIYTGCIRQRAYKF